MCLFAIRSNHYGRCSTSAPAGFFTETMRLVYSNCEEVRPFCDGQLVCVQKPDPSLLRHAPVTLCNVVKSHDRSELRAEGLIDGKVVASRTRFSPGVGRRLALRADLVD